MAGIDYTTCMTRRKWIIGGIVVTLLLAGVAVAVQQYNQRHNTAQGLKVTLRNAKGTIVNTSVVVFLEPLLCQKPPCVKATEPHHLTSDKHGKITLPVKYSVENAKVLVPGYETAVLTTVGKKQSNGDWVVTLKSR